MRRRRETSALDALLMRAKCAASNHRYPGFCRVAAREADLLRYPRVEDHGEGKILAASAVRLLMRCLERFGDPGARATLADGLAKVVDAIRAEPDRPKPRPEPNLYYVDGDEE